jgi:hypothetical protein
MIISPSFKYLNKANKRMLNKMVDVKAARTSLASSHSKFWPLRLDQLARVKLKENSNFSHYHLSKKLVEFLDFKNESLSIFIFYFV